MTPRWCVARAGVEPATFRFSGGRSYQLSYLAPKSAAPDGAVSVGRAQSPEPWEEHTGWAGVLRSGYPGRERWSARRAGAAQQAARQGEVGRFPGHGEGLLMPMTPLPAPPRSRRAPGRTLAALALTGSAAVAGCGSPGELRSTGPAPAATAPVLVWPEREVTAPQGLDIADDGPTRVPGVARVPSGDIRGADAKAVLRADARATDRTSRQDPVADAGNPWPLVGDCFVPNGAECAIRPAAYHDLTGDGVPELVMGVDLAPDLCEVRVYTVTGGAVIRILVAGGNVRTVEVADGELIIREPDWTKGYDSSTVYRWDGRKMAYQGHLIQKSEPSGRSVPRLGHGGPALPSSGTAVL